MSQNTGHYTGQSLRVIKEKPLKSKVSVSENQLASEFRSKLDFYNQYSVEDRTLIWEQNRKKKLVEIQNQNKDKDLDECTFQPNLSSHKNDYLKGSSQIEGKVNVSSIDKYLSRMYMARAERENKKIEQDNAIGSGKNWKKQTTVPKPPKLSYKRNDRFKQPFNVPIVNRNTNCPISNKAKYIQHNDGSTNRMIKDHKKQIRTNKLVSVEANMDYFDAVSMIHDHIMDLDI